MKKGKIKSCSFVTSKVANKLGVFTLQYLQPTCYCHEVLAPVKKNRLAGKFVASSLSGKIRLWRAKLLKEQEDSSFDEKTVVLHDVQRCFLVHLSPRMAKGLKTGLQDYMNASFLRCFQHDPLQ